MQTIGFIGCGKMAQAMIKGLLHHDFVKSEQIMASASSKETLVYVSEHLNIEVCADNKSVAKHANLLFLAVPPSAYQPVMEEIRSVVDPSVIIVTVAAGISMSDVGEIMQMPVKVVRSMPNTPSLIGAGMSAICANSHVTTEELEQVQALFQSFGEVEVIAENQMDAIPAISGSSPAYVYVMIEAMADGGVKQGLSREQAYRFASQAVIGAAKMVLETGKHPGELKDQVCSPGGATIEAIATLEEKQFRSAIISAMDSCFAKVKQLGKK